MGNKSENKIDANELLADMLQQEIDDEILRDVRYYMSLSKTGKILHRIKNKYINLLNYIKQYFSDSVLGINKYKTTLNDEEINGYAIKGVGRKYNKCCDYINSLPESEVIDLFTDFPWFGIAFENKETEKEFVKKFKKDIYTTD